MTESDRDRALEEALRLAKPEGWGTPDFAAWERAHFEAVDRLKMQALSAKAKSPPPREGRRYWGRLAAMVSLLLALGYALGRYAGPARPDVEALRLELEASLRDEVIKPIGVQWQETLQANCDQLRFEILRQLQGDLADLATQTLAASASITDRRMTELIRLIESARERDRQRVALALEQIETNRLRDRIELGGGLQLLAARTAESADLKTN